MDFHRTVLEADPSRRGIVMQILTAALAAVDPAAAVRANLTRAALGVEVGGNLFAVDSVAVVALGKAAMAMARAACEALSGLPARGIVVSQAHPAQDPIEGLAIHHASHPLPDERSLAAAEATIELVTNTARDELVLFLISGGGSALIEKPADGLSLEDLRSTIDTMLRGGVPIGEMNAVRTHLSAIKGGRLAAASGSPHLATLLVSDVSSHPPEVVASGPSLGDPTTFADALAVLVEHRLADSVPRSAVAHLEAGAQGDREETPAKVGDQVTKIVADGATAAEAAGRTAADLGLDVSIASTTLHGEARTEAVNAVKSTPKGRLTVLAGETTVHVTGSGVGGRNQEAALAAAMEIAGSAEILFASLGTDGVDGPTDAAGAVVDGLTLERGELEGLSAVEHLEANDSHTYLAATGDLIRTGPTGTNVGDVWLVWRQ
ncbi:glycerate kinase [soil metagenome]